MEYYEMMATFDRTGRELTDEERLSVRGWRKHRESGWLIRPLTGRLYPFDTAAERQRIEDRRDAAALGTVLFRPSAEQQTDPLLTACAARELTERDVIDLLHTDRLRLLEALTKRPPEGDAS